MKRPSCRIAHVPIAPVLIAIALLAFALIPLAPAIAWQYWGGDAGGMRFSPLDTVTPANVDRLIKAWEFRTGERESKSPALMARTKSEATPLFVEDSLISCTPFNDVIALDPGTGALRWRFSLNIRADLRPANRWTCRGVAYFRDEARGADAACRSRIVMGTNDARVIALDARTGQRCADFGRDGEVKLDPGMPLEWPGEFQITSAPVISHGVVVVGSAIADNRRVEAPRGAVHGLDARTGAIRWTWDPLKHDGVTAGHANVWAPMSADDATGLLFLPTTSASPDFWGGKRPGDNAHANSVVALRIETGELVWAYQTVHHDVWDYDLPAQPTLARIETGNGPHDVVIQGTKQGFLFVLDRMTGQPIWPVEERPVPQNGAEGEVLSPTQPFPTHLPALVPQTISADEAFGLIPFWDRAQCRERLASARNEGLYTPPSTQGTLLFPMTGGGINWGGVAFDPVNQILYANTTRAVHRVTLVPRNQISPDFKPPPGHDFGAQLGTPFAVTRAVLTSPLGMLCNPPPWGVLEAIDLKAGKILWQSTVGTTEDLAPLALPFHWGTPLLNGVLITKGGLVFTGAADAYLRAFDAKSGKELWQGRLPVPGIANPMTYRWNDEQYIVINAGGQSEIGTSIGDSFVAFRLARGDESPSLRSRTLDRPGGRFWSGAVGIIVALGGLIAIAVTWRRRRIRRAS